MKRRKIYVASSWRNNYYPIACNELKNAGHEIYDFRNPGQGKQGFSWDFIDRNWKQWTPELYAFLLKNHPEAAKGFKNDFDAMNWADTFVLIMPAGRSAHLEIGWASGADKDSFVLLNDTEFEPDLMYLCCTDIFVEMDKLLERLKYDKTK